MNCIFFAHQRISKPMNILSSQTRSSLKLKWQCNGWPWPIQNWKLLQMLNWAMCAVQWIYAGITFVQGSWSNAYWFVLLIKGVIEPHKGQRIGDCFQTMWVLCFPNSAAIVPPTFHSTIYILFLFSPLLCYFSQQIFPKANVFKQNTGLGGESWKNLRLHSVGGAWAAKWISLSRLCPTILTENSLSLKLPWPTRRIRARLFSFTLWRPEALRAPRPDCRSLIDLCQDGSQCAQTDAP